MDNPLTIKGHPHFQFHAECASSNDLALDWIRQGAPEGALVLCDSQLAGRGRQGRSWHSPPACNLYLSRVVWGPAATLPLLSLAGALAIRDAVEAFLPQPVCARIKWPNDVWVDGAKIAGILVERGMDPSPLTAACALGMGLNVNLRTDQFPKHMRSPATSLREVCGHEMDRNSILRAVLESLERWIHIWREDADRIAPAMASHCMSLGRRVRVSEPGIDPWFGHAQSVELDGRLLIRDENGLWRRLSAAYVDPC